MRIVVTGAAGQLGGELCRLWGAQAVGLDRARCDVTDAATVRRVMTELRPDLVVHCAGYTQVDRAETDAEACMAANAGAVAALAEACNVLGAKLVYISTDYVFGGDIARATPYRETDAPAPQGVYARSKLAGESHAAGCRRHLIVRTCGLYGHSPHRNNFVETILRRATEGLPLRVVNDQCCSPTSAVEAALAIRYLVEAQAEGIYHVVNCGDVSWHEFAVMILEVSGIRQPVEPITTAQLGAPAPRPAYSVLDTAKYRALGGPLTSSVADALATYVRARKS